MYYLLDDNRLYRRTDPPISEDPPVTPTRRARPKSNTKRARALARAAKRRKLAAEEAASEGDHDNDDQDQDSATAAAAQHSDRNQGYKWECVAISLAQYREFVEILKKSKDPNEQILRDRIIEHIIPVVEKWEESQQRKIAKRERELLNMARMATAKKSSRLAEKHERERQEREAAEAEKRLQAQQESAARKEKERAKTDEERRRRLMKRERRMQDREERRKHNQIMLDRLHEEAKQLAHSGETNVAGRMSERRLKNEIARRREEMDSIRDDESWVFDCAVCGVHGENLVSLTMHPTATFSYLFSVSIPTNSNFRMMASTVSLAKSAMFGSIASVLEFPKMKPRSPSSISSVAIASDAVKKRRDGRR